MSQSFLFHKYWYTQSLNNREMKVKNYCFQYFIGKEPDSNCDVICSILE